MGIEEVDREMHVLVFFIIFFLTLYYMPFIMSIVLAGIGTYLLSPLIKDKER